MKIYDIYSTLNLFFPKYIYGNNTISAAVILSPYEYLPELF